MRITIDELSEIVFETVFETANSWEALLLKIKDLSNIVIKVTQILGREGADIRYGEASHRGIEEDRLVDQIVQKIREEDSRRHE